MQGAGRAGAQNASGDPREPAFVRSRRVAWAVHDAGGMSLDLTLGLVVSLGLAVYLVYALVRPERF